MRDRPFLVLMIVVALALLAGSAAVSWLANDKGFDWELASIVGTALGTTFLAAMTGWLANSTRTDVRATSELARLTKEDQDQRRQANLDRAFSAYLAAVDTLVTEYHRRPWFPWQPWLKRLRRGGFLARSIYAVLFSWDITVLQKREGDRASQVWDRYTVTTADLRMVAPAPLLLVVQDIEDMFSRWRNERPVLEEWPAIRERLITAHGSSASDRFRPGDRGA